MQRVWERIMNCKYEISMDHAPCNERIPLRNLTEMGKWKISTIQGTFIWNGDCICGEIVIP